MTYSNYRLSHFTKNRPQNGPALRPWSNCEHSPRCSNLANNYPEYWSGAPKGAGNWAGDRFNSHDYCIRRWQLTERPTSPRDLTKTQESIVFVIDDDEGMRRALANLFRSVGLEVQVFASASEMLQSKLPDVASCLVLDVRLPGLSGLDFQIELAKANIHIPIIFVTGHGDIPMTVRAMKGGAIDFLTKPFRDQDMLDSAMMAIERDRKRREAEKTISVLRAHFETLTPREREVLALVTAGLMNKQIAAEIGIAEITVKIHRGHVMKKMGARSLADLIRMAEAIGIRRAKP